jgi:hypothetical protein
LADESSAVTPASPPQATNAATPGVRATAASLEPSLPAPVVGSLWSDTLEPGLWVQVARLGHWRREATRVYYWRLRSTLKHPVAEPLNLFLERHREVVGDCATYSTHRMPIPGVHDGWIQYTSQLGASGVRTMRAVVDALDLAVKLGRLGR